MAIELSTPREDELGDVVRVLRDWQNDASPMQLHPGDLGWYWRFGAEAVAAAVRTWRRRGHIVAIGFLDGPRTLRLTVAPLVWREKELAGRVLSDLSEPRRGVLPAGGVSVESPNGTRLQELLSESGWGPGESWTPLRHDLSTAVQDTGVRTEVVGWGQEPEFTAVHRSAWDRPAFTDALWREMAAGLPFADARCLLARDEHGVAVAGVTVWSAGPGRPGLVEPLGVHAEHRGRGYGRMVGVAAAAELKKLGSSCALVCTPSARASAVATYESAGFQRLPVRLDRSRTG
ncbi:GNAT family N-acetyltransferase [Cellulomonas sp. URHE0023]|uniref:GNAT family N-acetyltransferase n=1 Tax=Cellulomonas sp. URHE0023 TaxID=1380354 RepID=UPI0004882A6C|nr:GNAT family N-acetyltransferase [Cellulomonas sp. URHE0023]